MSKSKAVGARVVCPECNGDGIGRCDNPDHGFISAMPGEIGRLGCPVCGHDPDHKTGEVCETCNGEGDVPEDIARTWILERK